VSRDQNSDGGRNGNPDALEPPPDGRHGRRKEQEVYTDGRKPWEWESKYPPEARREITFEARVLSVAFVLLLAIAGIFLGLADQSVPIALPWIPATLYVNFRVLAIYFVGSVGGLTFSIKWLIHSAAKGKWHHDRCYWRFLVPLLGGVYACVVLTLIDAGLLGGAQLLDKPRPIAIATGLAFLVG
jgi:hypothetical protein